ncbi:MAG: GAF domain-containing protein [Chroococcus sp. CMT-3BRIN-NPC107]|nr:GAF domain-containing protein [Chroococcus sp. CMT-3BRIN-NPC107]
MIKLFSSRAEDRNGDNPSISQPLAIAQTSPKPKPDTPLNSNSQSSFKFQRQVLSAITAQMRHSPNLEALFEITVREIKQALHSDRVLIYRFEANNQGIVIAEEIGREWTPTLGEKLPATWFGEDEATSYLSKQIVEIATDTGTTPYQQQLVERFQVKSSVSLPILVGREVWGLLVVQQCSKLRYWEEVEINLLERLVLELTIAVQAVEFRTKQIRQAEFTRTSTQVAARVMDKIRRSFDIDTVFRTTTSELLHLLKAERVAVYKFLPDWSGKFVSEAVAPGWIPFVGNSVQTWVDSYLQENQGGRYKHNETYAVDDIYQAGYAPNYIHNLEEHQVRAYAIAPIFFGGDLWGLLAAYQNSAPRQWEEVDVNALAQVATQLGVALRQAEYLQQVNTKTKELAQIAQQERTLAKVIDKIRNSLDINVVFNTTTQEVRQLLQVDRVVVYRFNADWSGEFVAESVAPGWTSVISKGFKEQVGDCAGLQSLRPGNTSIYQQQGLVAQDRNRQSFSVDDIFQVGFSAQYLESMEQIEAKAYLTTSIFVGDKLWGLLATYQNSGPRQWQKSEEKLLTQIGNQFGIALQQAEYLQQVEAKTQQLTQIAEQERTVYRVIDKIRKSLDLNEIFKATTQEVRKLLKADRVLVYQFNADWSGKVVSESVGASWTPLAAQKLNSDLVDCDSVRGLAKGSDRYEDTHLKESKGGRYRQDKEGFRVNDIYEAGFSPCYIQSLERFEARAYVTIPIFAGEQLWGLLSTYQNSGPRQWEESEEKLVNQIGIQFGIAVQQAATLEKIQIQAQKLLDVGKREKAAKEKLQQTAIQLLIAVRPALEGDLTVRAKITEDELGTIADAYNNTIQSLRKLVIEVKKAADNVALTSNNSESAIVNLSTQAQYQVEELTDTLEQIQEMVNVTQIVSHHAQQVEVALHQANQTVETGNAAMSRTVDGILEIKKTVTDTGKKIKRLSESSQKISRVVSLISNFSNQTQLLALNAAIEATRAGEYGRGFAVVADEVRSLARQSAKATNEIEKLVQEIQAETIDVALAMETGIEQVAQGTDLVNQTRQSLDAIALSTAEISQLVQGITSSTLAQTQQSEAVTQTITDLAVVATRTSAGSVQISHSFQDLLVTAQNLQTSIERFKVS